MKTNSLGTFTVATEFVPMFPPKDNVFKPLVIKRVNYEDCKIKTQKSVCSTSYETQSWIAPQDQQTTPSETEQADS